MGQTVKDLHTMVLWLLTPFSFKLSVKRFSLINGEAVQSQFVASASRLLERFKVLRHGKDPNGSGISSKLFPLASIALRYV